MVASFTSVVKGVHSTGIYSLTQSPEPITVIIVQCNRLGFKATLNLHELSELMKRTINRTNNINCAKML